MRLWTKVLAGVVAVVLALPAALLAQQPPPSIVFSFEELEQVAAPVALYSDPLLAQVLMAATYPLEVVQAARFVQANPALKDGRLDEALRTQNWDDSVKALAQFPQILDMMDDNLQWMQKLGDAFLVQEQDLMDAVQRLRARAQARGGLATTAQQTVTVESMPARVVIQIVPADPEVIYVPVYNPLVVFGPWPYPAYPPYHYYPVGWPVGRTFFGFGRGTFVGFGLWGTCDWQRRNVFVDVPRYRRFTMVVNAEGRRGEFERGRIGPREGDRLTWQHDVHHRKGVEYQRTATPQRFDRPRLADVPSRAPVQARPEQPKAEQARTAQPRVEQPRVEQGRPQSGRGGQEPARHPEPRVQASSAPVPVPAQPRAPGTSPAPSGASDTWTHGERGHEGRHMAAAPSPTVRSAPVISVPAGGTHEASPLNAPSGGVTGGSARR